MSENIRVASPQAWRRLRKTMTVEELRNISEDIAGTHGGDAKEIFQALTQVDWEERRQG